MPSSATRILELKLMIDTSQFDAGIRRVISTMRQLNSAGINISRGFNTVTTSLNRTTTSLHGANAAAVKTRRGFGALFLETKGGIRVFGGEHGLLKAFALVRNHLLLMAFGFGPFIHGLKGAVTASVEFTNAMTGLGAIAKATGEKVDVTQTAAKSLAEKGFMTVTEATMGLKNLLATGFGLEEAMKVMKGFADSAAFNRQASFQWGEAVVRATEGIRLGLCIAEGSMIYDASTNDYKPVEDLFDECMKKDKKLITLGYDTNKNNFISVQASHIAYNGIKPVYKIKTSSGKEVEATENHRFLTKDGYKLLKDLKVDDVLVGMDNHSAINKKPKKEIKCKNCDIYFLPSNGREYLCLDCKTVICKQCGKAFIVKPKHLKIAHFCSKDCLAKWQSENMSGFNSPITKHGDSFTFVSLICKSCGAEYKRTKKWLKTNKSSFCSCECKKEWQKGKTAKKFFTSVVRECETCGKEVIVKNCHKDTFRFCSRKCRAVWQSEVLMQRENNPNWGGGTTKGRRVLEGKKEYRRWKNAVKERDLFICQNCGIEFNLNAHHIFHYKNYPDRVYDVSNGITLCQSCHIEAHRINRTFCKTEETIVSIEYAGEKRTYDLSVPETRNFIVNGLVSHNSNVADACFVYTTPVLTDKGTVSIGDIVEKNLDVKVYSYDFKKKKVVKKKIINKFNNGTKEVYRITTESGKSFVATGNHRFYTLDGSKKELLEFSVGEELVLWEHRENSAPINILSGDKIKSIEFEGIATTYNITVEEVHNYFVGSENTFILSSNSGITKNLSQILVEQGKSMQDVSKISSDASVRQALLNGLMKEFTLYTGNAELALGTYSGSLSVLKTSLFNLKKEIGDSLVPILGKLVRGLSDSVKEATRWYKINRDIIDLKLQGFIDFAEPIKDFVVFIGKATAAIVDFATENKNLVYTLAALAVLNKVTGMVKALIPHIITLIAALGAFAARVRAVGFITALTVTLGPLQLAFIALAAVVATISIAFAVFRDRQKDVTKAALENNAALTKQARMQQEYLEIRKKATSAELDAVKAKIKSGDSSVYLKNKEEALTAQLSNLEKQTLKTTFAIEKLELAKQRIEYEKTGKEALTPEFFNVSSISSYGAMYAEQRKMRKVNLLGGLMNQLNPEALLTKIQGAETNQWWKWDEIYAEAQKGLEKIGKFGAETYSALNEASREHLENTKRMYETAIKMAGLYKWHEIDNAENKTKLTEDELKELKKKQDAYYDLYDKISDKYFKSVSSEWEYKKWALAQEVAEYKQALREMGVSKEQFEKASLLIQETYSLQRKQLLYDELNAMKKPDMKAIREQMGIKELGITPYGRQREEIDTGVVDYATREVERQKEALKKIAPEVQKITQQVADAYWTERAEIARARDAELDDLRKQLSQGTIDTQEYMARRNQIMTNANIQMANATKNAWKQAGQAAFDTMGQMLTNHINKVIAAAVFEKQTMSMLSGTMLAGLGGLGVGLLMAGGSYLLSQAFQEKPTVDYQSINPSSSSEAERKRYGSLAAAPVQYINVIPTLNFEAVNGSYILIGSGTVEEFSDEVSELIKNTVNAAIATNEIGLAGLSPQ